MIRPLQLTSIGGLQAPTVGLQAGSLPATTAQQIDINSIFNLMLIMVMTSRGTPLCSRVPTQVGASYVEALSAWKDPSHWLP